ncbi:MAG: D-threonine aldolase [Alphaproteobacteria bacterium MarineAlpha9_Bin7]|nr:MAG: D-threonine aldolase [Alphaproteobacteria bacterium MarineAlpha9_Bin7]
MKQNLGPNAPLIGVKGGRTNLSTPALILDLASTAQNIQAMIQHCQHTNQKLRPHGKSHKSSVLAQRQIKAGAIGICCATIREAEVMVQNGIPGVLITSPITSNAKIERLVALHQRTTSLMTVVDDLSTVAAIAAAHTSSGSPNHIELLVDFDVGLHRTGTRDADAACNLAHSIADTEGLSFVGIQAYAGHLQHIENFDARLQQMAGEAERLKHVVTELCADGLTPNIITGGGTGTYDIDHRFNLFTELQAGSYIFTDVQYNAVHLNLDLKAPFKPSLMVQASVVSTAHDSHAVIDAGLKSFATDGPAPELYTGAPNGAEYRFMGDEHGAIVYSPSTNARLQVGDVVSCLVPHCDPTVNLYDHYHCVQGNHLIEILPIDARGNP